MFEFKRCVYLGMRKETVEQMFFFYKNFFKLSKIAKKEGNCRT